MLLLLGLIVALAFWFGLYFVVELFNDHVIRYLHIAIRFVLLFLVVDDVRFMVALMQNVYVVFVELVDNFEFIGVLQFVEGVSVYFD
jgi:hypothetical protein